MSGDNDVKSTLIAAVLTLIGTLLLGSYIYTWSADKDQTKEKEEWRKENTRVLEKNFDEVKANQQKIEKVVTENQKETNKALQEILLEQKAQSQQRRPQ